MSRWVLSERMVTILYWPSLFSGCALKSEGTSIVNFNDPSWVSFFALGPPQAPRTSTDATRIRIMVPTVLHGDPAGAEICPGRRAGRSFGRGVGFVRAEGFGLAADRLAAAHHRRGGGRA